MSNDDTAQAAAAVTASILGEFATKHGEENAARMLEEMGVETPDAAPPAQPVASSPPPAAEAAPAPPAPAAEEAAPEPETVLPDLEPQLSDDIRALLDEPDFDEEAAAEVDAYVEEREPDESFDPDEAKRLRSLEKRNQWLEEQLANKSRKGWLEEQLRSYPLLREYFADDLKEALSNVTSRRAAARAAATLQERYAKALAKPLADLNAAKAAAKGEAVADARTQASEQWGLPYSEPAGAGVSVHQANLDKARQERKPLVERIKLLDKVISGGR